MAVNIREIYSPILGYGWENLPTDYAKRQYAPIEDGIVTTPGGVKLGTARLTNGNLRLINTSGTVCAQWWTGDSEMAVVDPFNNQVFTVPTTNDLKCNAREMVSAHIDIAKAQPLDLSNMWTDPAVGECGFYIEDLSLGENKYTDRLNGSVLLALTPDEDGNYVVGRNSVLCRLLRYMSGDRFAFIDYRKKSGPSLLTDNNALTDYAHKILAWAQSLTTEQREILSR